MLMMLKLHILDEKKITCYTFFIQKDFQRKALLTSQNLYISVFLENINLIRTGIIFKNMFIIFAYMH